MNIINVAKYNKYNLAYNKFLFIMNIQEENYNISIVIFKLEKSIDCEHCNGCLQCIKFLTSCRKIDNKIAPNQIQITRGEVNKNENPDDASIRHLKEQVGLIIDKKYLLKYYEFKRNDEENNCIKVRTDFMLLINDERIKDGSIKIIKPTNQEKIDVNWTTYRINNRINDRYILNNHVWLDIYQIRSRDKIYTKKVWTHTFKQIHLFLDIFELLEKDFEMQYNGPNKNPIYIN